MKPARTPAPTTARRTGMQSQQARTLIHPYAIESKLENLRSMVADVWSIYDSIQLFGATQIRKLISIEQNQPFEEVVQSGIVPRLVQFLERENFPLLQIEAPSLANIASGTSDHTQVVIDHGAVPIFVKHLGSPNDRVREQVVWALGNIAGDSPQCRVIVLSHGALIPLLQQLNEHTELSMLRNAARALSNFFRGTPPPPFEQIKPALPALERLMHSDDEEVLSYTCWVFSYMSNGTDDNIQAIIKSGVGPRLVELLRHPSPSVLILALDTVGNMVSGGDELTQYIVNHQILPCLRNLLTHNTKSDKKLDCWTISNISAGNWCQIQAVIKADIIDLLINLLQTAEFDIKKEAAWAILNASYPRGINRKHIKYLVTQGCIKVLCDLLICPEPMIVAVCLEALENILEVGELEKNEGKNRGVNLYAELIDQAEGLDKIENLQSHDNTEIYERAVNILETYWLLEDDETLPPIDAFCFGENELQVPSGGFNFPFCEPRRTIVVDRDF